jgi:hypothetical protein
MDTLVFTEMLTSTSCELLAKRLNLNRNIHRPTANDTACTWEYGTAICRLSWKMKKGDTFGRLGLR